MNIALSGSKGFIGSHLLPELRKDHHVIELTRDLLRSVTDNELKELLCKNRVDIIVHLATHFTTSFAPRDIAELTVSNVLLGRRLLEAIKDSPKVWFLNTGSGLEHGGRDQKTPINRYASSKRAFSLILQSSRNPHVTLTIFESYGPNDRRGKFLQLLHEASLSGTPLKASPGEQVLNYCHVSDISAAYLHVLGMLERGEESLLNGKEFGLAGELLSLRGLAALYDEVSGRSTSVDWGAIPYRESEIMMPALLDALPGWKAKLRLKDEIHFLLS